MWEVVAGTHGLPDSLNTSSLRVPVSPSLRRIAFPLRLVAARLRGGGERLALIAVGVVAGAAVLAAVLAGRLVMQDRALAQATARLAPADRQITVAWFGAVAGTGGGP